MRLAIIAVVLVASSVARADDRDDFLPLDMLGQVGLGATITNDRYIDADHFDGTLRFGKTWRATDRWRPGAFVELHTISFDTLDAAIGPQVQMRVGDYAALQLRGGVGVDSDGQTHALVGAQFGMSIIAAGVTARRSFESGDTVVSVNVELTAALPLIPVFLAMLKAGVAD